MTAAATDSARLPAHDSSEVCPPRQVEVVRSASIAGSRGMAPMPLPISAIADEHNAALGRVTFGALAEPT